MIQGEIKMGKRLLDCNASDFLKMGKEELLAAIAGSEGRTIACETIGTIQPALIDISNAEFVSSMGADLLLLNMFDVNAPVINGLPTDTKLEEVVRTLKHLTGRPVGINLEPIDKGSCSEVETKEIWKLTGGRQGTAVNAKKAADMGVDFILLTGNPGIGVSNETIVNALKEIKADVGDRIILAAGKMHAAGVLSESGDHIISKCDVKEFRDAGADVILLPAPGTVPGITQDYAHELISFAHSIGALVMTSIGTSQEGADTDTIRRIALMCKMAGADIHHIGDTGYAGMALPENIFAYSVAIRGIRHTYHRIASSVNR